MNSIQRRGQGLAGVILILLLVAGVGTAAAWKMRPPEPSIWLDPADAWDAAATERKPALFLYTADWCPPCRDLKKGALGDAAVLDALQSRFVLVKCDLTERGGPNDSVAAEHGVRGIPSMIVYDEDGYKISEYRGDRSSEDLLSWAERCAG